MPWPSLEFGLFLVLVAGGVTPTHASTRRSIFHLMNSAAFAGFAILGLAALRVVLPATLASALLLAAAFTPPGRFLRRYLLPEGLGLIPALARLGLAAVFLTIALFGAGGLVLGASGSFPMPLRQLRDLFVFIACATTFGCVLAALNEAYHRWFSPPVRQAATVPRDFGFLPSDAPLYRLMLLGSSALQVLAHFLYLSYGVLGLFFALGWFALAIRVQAALLRERLRLNNAFLELEASHRALATGELTSRIVHQTRHQLGLIGISTHLIQDALKRLPPDRTKIQEQVARLDGVVAALRRMLQEALQARGAGADVEPTSGPKPPEPGLSLRAIVLEEVERLSSKAEQLGVRLELPPGPPALIPHLADGVEPLSQGVFNVVDNALGAARGLVRVLVEESEAERRVIVEDDGPGMSPEMLRRAGKPFVTTKPEGTGVGLFMAVAAVKRWSGSLAFENRREGGHRVTFRLPRAEAKGDAVPPPR